MEGLVEEIIRKSVRAIHESPQSQEGGISPSP